MIAELPAIPVQHLRYEPLRRGEIRILLLQPGCEDDPIRFFLMHITLLAAQNNFTALSYTWGDPLNRRAIECNELGEKILLTQNCINAIRTLRSPRKQGAFWIDAICISQNDLSERESQVAKMGDIYRSAAEVIVYLGTDEGQSSTAMSFVESVPDIDFLASLQPHTTDALDALLHRPWFARIWMLQEVHNAKKVRLVCGQSEANWSDLLLYKWWHHLGRRDFESWPLVMSVRDRSRYGPNDFLRLLIQARKCGASDPRDKVYAILPMIREDREELPRPDYTLSREQVYLETAISLSKFNIDFLCAVSHQPGTLDNSNEPSWVPQWDQDDGCTMIWPDTGKALAEEIELDRNGDIVNSPYKINQSEFYQAGGDEPSDRSHSHQILPNPGLGHSTLSLKVKGTRVALITTLSAPVFTSLNEIRSESSPFRTLWRAMKPQTCNTYYQDPAALFRWAQHPLHRSVDTAMAHAMWYTRNPNTGPFGRQHAGGTDMHLRREAAGMYRLWREEVLGLINGRRIFILEDGGMGMAPAEARVGDAVCLLFGAPVPFVLRRVERGREEGYKLVGPCYLNGMMTKDGLEQLKMECCGSSASGGGTFGRDFILC